jgi:hypothetical protein
MTQFNMHRWIKEFVNDGVEAILQELQQLHDCRVLRPVNASSLSHEDWQCALAYLMFLEQKRDEKIKGRGCADGRKLREIFNKEEASSPTVSIEAVLTTCVIDAHENWDDATIDIPGAFMQADTDELVDMKLVGTMAVLLVKIDPWYVSEIRDHRQEGETRLIFRATIWDFEGSPTFLEKVCVDVERMGIRNDPVRLVRGQQNDKRSTVNNTMAR